MTDSAVVDVQGAWKRFGKFTAVADMSLSVHPGEIVGLIGANGAGKTTLIRMVLGLEAANAGTLAVFGRPPSRQTRRRLGYMPQGLGLYRELTVRENVDFVAEAFGVDGPPLPDALATVAARQVGALPLGLRRRLAFHCALLHGPELIVLDEPTSGVDPLARTRLWDTIHDQADAGRAVLVTTHYMEEARQCSRLVIMSRGRLVAHGRVPDIIGDERALAVHTADWAGALSALTAAGLPVTLAGRSVRVAGAEAARVEETLAGVAIPAEVARVPATLEEKLVLLERSVRT